MYIWIYVDVNICIIKIYIEIQYTSPVVIVEIWVGLNECSRMVVKICIIFQLAYKQFFKIYFDVNILDRPIVTVPGTITETDTTVTIHCTASGSPALTAIHWLLNDRNLSSTDNTKYSGGNLITPSLTINKIASTDIGEYRCVATNLVGSTTSSQSVTLGKIILI